jgi:Kef-type K+ transport system membrane component KefB
MVPLFFVVLGARIDLRALGQHPTLIALAALLVVFNIAVHTLAARLTRQPLGAGLAATAQLGVPAAVVTLGLERHILTNGEGSAIVAAALVSLALTAAGVTLLGRRRSARPVNDRDPQPEPGS